MDNTKPDDTPITGSGKITKTNKYHRLMIFCFGIFLIGRYNSIVSLNKYSRNDYQISDNLLKEISVAAELRQVDLAGKLKRSQSFVSKYKSGERRLDVLEVRIICEHLGVPFVDFIQ